MYYYILWTSVIQTWWHFLSYHLKATVKFYVFNQSVTYMDLYKQHAPHCLCRTSFFFMNWSGEYSCFENNMNWERLVLLCFYKYHPGKCLLHKLLPPHFSSKYPNSLPLCFISIKSKCKWRKCKEKLTNSREEMWEYITCFLRLHCVCCASASITFFPSPLSSNVYCWVQMLVSCEELPNSISEVIGDKVPYLQEFYPHPLKWQRTFSTHWLVTQSNSPFFPSERALLGGNACRKRRSSCNLLLNFPHGWNKRQLWQHESVLLCCQKVNQPANCF